MSGARSKSRPQGGNLPHTQCRPPGGIATRGAVRVWRLMIAFTDFFVDNHTDMEVNRMVIAIVSLGSAGGTLSY